LSGERDGADDRLHRGAAPDQLGELLNGGAEQRGGQLVLADLPQRGQERLQELGRPPPRAGRRYRRHPPVGEPDREPGVPGRVRDRGAQGALDLPTPVRLAQHRDRCLRKSS
jgi:hypothetical protein